MTRSRGLTWWRGVVSGDSLYADRPQYSLASRHGWCCVGDVVLMVLCRLCCWYHMLLVSQCVGGELSLYAERKLSVEVWQGPSVGDRKAQGLSERHDYLARIQPIHTYIHMHGWIAPLKISVRSRSKFALRNNPATRQNRMKNAIEIRTTWY